jgi:GNAT superfamily N-acetyltransferase
MNAELHEGRPEDATALAFMPEFNASRACAFDERRARRALEELLTSPDLGRIWLIVARGAAVGYVVLTLGFSLEYGGRDAFIDEFYVQPQSRGQGFGRAQLCARPGLMLGRAHRTP